MSSIRKSDKGKGRDDNIDTKNTAQENKDRSNSTPVDGSVSITTRTPSSPLQQYKLNKARQIEELNKNTHKNEEKYIPKHCPYVQIFAKFGRVKNPVIVGENYIKCFIESENPKSTLDIKYLFKFEQESDEVWIANLYLGEIAHIQVWHRSLIGEDVFLGEILDNRSLTRLKYLSYDYFTDQSLIRSSKLPPGEYTPRTNEIRSLFIIPSDRFKTKTKTKFEIRRLYCLGGKNNMLKISLEKKAQESNHSQLAIALLALIPRTEPILKIAKFYNHLLEAHLLSDNDVKLKIMKSILLKMNIRPPKKEIGQWPYNNTDANSVSIYFHLHKLDRRNSDEENLILNLIRIYAVNNCENDLGKTKPKNPKPLNEDSQISDVKKHREEKRKKKWENFFDPKTKISANRWGKFLYEVQGEDVVKKDKMDYLLKHYPVVRLRLANEKPEIPRNLAKKDAKIERWFKGYTSLNDKVDKPSKTLEEDLNTPLNDKVDKPSKTLEEDINTSLNDKVDKPSKTLKEVLKFFPPIETLATYNDISKAILHCSRKAFFEYLFDPEENSIMNPEREKILKEDMSHPICDYWIDSSHNTYLSGDQLFSYSSIEMYRRALLRGCRCVELDVHDGDGNVPIVFHGYTLTSKVTFYDCIEAICESAFIVSDYPVILSLEVHCGPDGQKSMAKILSQLLRKKQFIIYPENTNDVKELDLWVPPGKIHKPTDNTKKHLTPYDLRHKILIKTAGQKNSNDEKEEKKKKQDEIKTNVLKKGEILQYLKLILQFEKENKKQKEEEEKEKQKQKEESKKKEEEKENQKQKEELKKKELEKEGTEGEVEKEEEGEAEKKRVEKEAEKKRVEKEAEKKRVEKEVDKKKEEKQLNSELSSYAHIPTKKTDMDDALIDEIKKLEEEIEKIETEQKNEEIDSTKKELEQKNQENNSNKKDGRREWHVTSIEEDVGIEIMKDTTTTKKRNALKLYNKWCLSRIYPRGTRIKSDNYCPIPYWDIGCQIVALNYQTSLYPMWLNEGKFMKAGRSGYILKPDYMRKTSKKVTEEDKGKKQEDPKKVTEEKKKKRKQEPKEDTEEDKGKQQEDPKKDTEEDKGKKKEEPKKVTEEEKDYTLYVKVISGWRLPRPWGDDTNSISSAENISQPVVYISFWSAEDLLQKYEVNKEMVAQSCKTERNKNPHNPIWNDKVHIFQGKDKNLDMLLFEVKDGYVERNNFKNPRYNPFVKKVINKTIGYFSITVDDIREGFRVIPLKGKEGAPLIAGELFVWTRITKGPKEDNKLDYMNNIPDDEMIPCVTCKNK